MLGLSSQYALAACNAITRMPRRLNTSSAPHCTDCTLDGTESSLNQCAARQHQRVRIRDCCALGLLDSCMPRKGTWVMGDAQHEIEVQVKSGPPSPHAHTTPDLDVPGTRFHKPAQASVVAGAP